MTHWYITVTEIICTIIAPENQKKKSLFKEFRKKITVEENKYSVL